MKETDVGLLGETGSAGLKSASLYVFAGWMTIFFHVGTLDYFHTHVCAPHASGCASLLAGATVTGRSSAPGKLTIGVLLPTGGTWKLFLQAKPDGRLVTVPYVLHAG